MKEDRDYYQILQVSNDATIEEIKAAFRRLARQYHPDLNQNNSTAAERFHEIIAAYEVLCDPIQRRQDDRDVNKGHPPEEKQEETPQDFYVRGVKKASWKMLAKHCKLMRMQFPLTII